MADASNNPEKPKVTRVKATDDTKTAKERKVTAPKNRDRRNPLRWIVRPFASLFSYFKGAWFELRQVRWPNRRATWGMTAALLGFTLFFVAFILIVDVMFENLFKLILR